MTDSTSRALTVLRESLGSPIPVPRTEKMVQGTDGKWQPNYWETLSSWMGFSGTTPQPLSANEALQQAAVLVCLDIISQDIAKTPLRLKKRLKGGKGAEIVPPREHWLARLLATKPNQWQTWYEFKDMVFLHLALVRNGFIAKSYETLSAVRSGEASGLLPIQPGRMTIDANADETDFVYSATTSNPRERVMMRGFGGPVFTSDRMIHIHGRTFDGLNGYSTLYAGATAMGLVREVTDFQTRLFRNDGNYRGVFQTKEDIEVSDEVFQRLRTQLGESVGHLLRQGRPLLLEGGVEYKAISQTSDQAETAKTRSAAIIDVFRLFRIPPHKAMQLEAVKYENLEQMEKSYVSDTLVPYCTQFEERVSHALLLPEESLDYFLEFDRDAMALQDAKAQAEINKVGLSFGAITINEYRATRGYNPLPDKAGDVRLIPSTYTVVDDKNAVVIPAGGTDNQASAPSGDAEAPPKKTGKILPLR